MTGAGRALYARLVRPAPGRFVALLVVLTAVLGVIVVELGVLSSGFVTVALLAFLAAALLVSVGFVLWGLRLVRGQS